MARCVFTVAFLLLGAASAPAPIPRDPDLRVSENEPFARINVRRNTISESILFFTDDRGARAGVDFVGTNGAVIFPEGQLEGVIHIALIDNSIADGKRSFVVFLTDTQSNSISGPLVEIVDNEVAASAINVDPAFVPEVSRSDLFYHDFGPNPFLPRVMPDGRVLVSGGLKGPYMTMLMPDGSRDRSFKPPLGAWPLAVLQDGRIWAALDDGSFLPSLIPLLRLRPDGSPDAIFGAPLRAFWSGPTAVQSDGKLLVFANGSLSRINLNGTIDNTFQRGVPSDGLISITVQSDDKTLVAGGFLQFNGEDREGLVRLNADGSIDRTFSPVLSQESPSDLWRNSVIRALQRRDGKVVIAGNLVLNGTAVRARPLIQLKADGTVDTSFQSDLLPSNHLQIFEEPDGSLLVADADYGFAPPHATLIRLRPDGSQDQSFILEPCCISVDGGPPEFAFTKQGELLMSWGFRNINGFSRPGLVRFLKTPAGRNFQVLTPAILELDGAVRVQVIRTGETSERASVDFVTLDASAIARRDYEPQAGTLEFSPLEVTKSIRIPLSRNPRFTEGLSFQLALTNPSSGYQTGFPVSVKIPSPLSLEVELTGAGAVFVGVRGTIPGRSYRLEQSPDLMNWQPGPPGEAGWITMRFISILDPPNWFFRMVGEDPNTSGLFRARKQ
jgi:uncharacterized delta-60 repeat protein